MIPSRAVKQNWQFTAQPIWLDTQIVARDHSFFASDPRRASSGEESPSSPPSPSGIHTVSTVCPSLPAIR
jgi:hypothetical protein